METNELLARVHEGNEEAFRLLFAQHGEMLYQSMIERCHDKRLAREALKDVFQKAYATLRSSPQPDGTALWLNELAMNSLKERLSVSQRTDAVCEEPQREAVCEKPQREQETVAAETLHGEPEEAERIICDVRRGMHEIPARKEHHVSTTVIAIILIALLLLTIWYIIGTLMKMGKLPYADLGYSWFSSHVLALF